MSRIKKIIALVSLIMALLLAVETPVSALTPVIKQSEASAISAEDQEYAFGESSEEVITSDLIIGELEDDRTEYTKSFRLENGNNMIVEYNLPIHYKNDANEWIDYDYSMVSSEKEITVATNKATTDEVEVEKRTIEVYSAKNSFQNISFAKNPDESGMAFIEDEESSVSWEYAGMNRTAAKVIETKNEYEGNDRYTVLDNLVSTIEYESAYPNVDIECISSPVGVKENIILRNRSAANLYTAIYHIGDLTAKQLDEKNIVLLNKDDEAEYYISAPYMFDAKNNTSENIQLSILDISDGNLTVELVADSEWLNEKDRSYPVTLDPTFIASREWGAVQCAFLDINHPNTAYGYGSSTGYTGTIYVGGYSTEAYRALIKMNSLPTLNPGDIIVDATVNLIPFNYDYSTNMYVGVYEATSSWNQSTVTWNNQPSCSGTLVDYSNMYTDLIDYSYYSWNITSLVKNWYNGATNNGFYLKAATSTSFDQAAGFYSSNYPYGQGLRPAFALTYRNNKGIEGYWSYNTFDVGSAGTMYVNDYSGSLTFVTSLASTASPIMPTSVSYIYNSYMAGTLFGRSLPNVGKGWKLNIQQNILPSSQFGLSDDAQTQYPYVYIDSDGTEHYFYKKSENGVTKYLDEDGLHLELTIQKTNSTVTGYTITDQDKNKMVFDSNGVLESTEDVYENSVNISKTIVTVNNTQRTKITSISDASSNTIGFDLNSNNYISNLTDPSNRVTSISYGTVAQGTAGCITSITRSDGTTVYFTYDSSGLMTSITDCDGYKIEITYDSSSSKKVSQIVEKGTNGATGQTIIYDRTKYNETIIRTSGVDGAINTNDDLFTTYQFDNYGRTISTQSKTVNGTDLGASNYEHTAGEPDSTGSNIKKINRISENHALGANAVNYIRNSNVESAAEWTKAALWGTEGVDTAFTWACNTSQSFYGQKAYCINVSQYTGQSAGRVYQDLTYLSPNTTYTLSAYAKVTSIANHSDNYGVFVCATTTDGSNVSASYYSEKLKEAIDTSGEEINNGWRRIETTFTTPPTLNKVRVHLIVSGLQGSAWFDAIQLEEAETAGSYNMIQNSSFERGTMQPSDWTSYENLNFSSSVDTIVTSQHQHGNSSFRIKGAIGQAKTLSQTIPVSGTEKDIYIVSGWVKANSVPTTSTRKLKISIQVIYSNNSVVTKDSANFNPTVSDWQFVSKAFDLSDGTEDEMTPKYIKISLNYSRQGNSAYFDNCALVKEPAASYNYDNDGHLISITETSKQSKAMEYDDDGHLTKYTDPKDYVTTYAYNAHGKLEKTTDNLGAEYTNEYDNNGFLTSTVGKHTYEGVTLRSRTKQNLSVDTSTNSYTITSYDSMNNSSEAKYNAKTGTLTSAKDKNNNETNYTYGSNNDLMTEVSASNHTVSYSYDNSNKHLTGVSTSSTTYGFTYDNFGNRTSTNVGGRILATYTYNSNNGNIASMKYGAPNGNGDTISYTYDKYGNVSEKKLNNNTVYQGVADNTGTITKVIDPVNNLSYTSSYDSTDRLIGTTVTDTNTNSRKAEFEYDFDNSNHISKLTTQTPVGSTTVNYTYARNNLPTISEIAGAKRLASSYDGLGRVKATALNTTTPIWTYYTFHGFSENNTSYTSSLIRTEQNKDFGFKYNYDANGNMTKLFVGTNTGGTDYTYSATETERYYYDALGQLTQVNYNDRNRRVVYTYDDAGNILSEKTYDISGSSPTLLATNTYTYGDSSWGDLLTGYNNNTFTYDAIGNPLNYRDGITFSWSNGRQLQSYSKDNTTVTYTYDNSGLRLSKNVNGTHYTYLYHGGNLMQETVGTKILDYFYDASGKPLAVKYRTSENSSPEWYYYALNSRGDVIGLYTPSGNLYCTYTYDVWGNILSVKNANGVEVTYLGNIVHLQSLKYRGYVYDLETGLYYLQSRYYDPVTHRFINADGLVSTGTGVLGYNMFAYCENNPIILIDYSGECILSAIAIGAFVGAAVGALVSAGSQYIETGEIRWEIVLFDSVVGAVAGAFAATSFGIGVQIAVNSALGGISYVGNQVITGQEVEPIGFGISVLAGCVAGCIGGPGSDGSALISSWKSASKSTARELRRANVKYATKIIANNNYVKQEVRSATLIAFTRFVLGASAGEYISNHSPVYPFHSIDNTSYLALHNTYLDYANKSKYYSFQYTKRLCK